MIKACVDCSKTFNDRDEDFRVRCYSCYVKYKEQKVNPFARSKSMPPMLPKEWHEFLNELPALLQLCHPDKHSQSDGSRRLTDWLLRVKKKHGNKRER